MKVTFCTREYDNVSGGQNTWLCRFVPQLRRRGIDPRVLYFTFSRGQELPTLRSLRQTGVDCATSYDGEIRFTEQRVRWVLERLAEDPPDVFVSNMVIPAAYYAGRWLREAGIPTIGICHGGGMYDLYPGLLDQFVFGRAAYQVSAYVCVSKYLEQDVIERHPKGIVIRRIPCGSPIPKEVAQKPAGRLRLAYVGQLVEERKRISEVTHALCRAVREVPRTEALIFGDGPDRRLVEQIIHKEANGSQVHLVGFVEHDQIQKHLLQCHAVVLLSDHEGLGLALIEGMACGLVPIGLRGAPGMAEFVVDNVTGLLANDRNDGFLTAVRRLREDPGLWERLARSARAQADAEYSDEVCTARWQSLFEELLRSSRPRKPLRIPWRLNLPPVHPALAVLDHRLLRFDERVLGRVRRLVSRVKDEYSGVCGLR